MADLWNHEDPISELGDEFDIPAWIEQGISPSDVAAIEQGGCASGAYMPAVTYHKAMDTMSEHGDDILQYIEDMLGELPSVKGQSWSQMACTYVSTAVELWASGISQQLSDKLDELEDAES